MLRRVVHAGFAVLLPLLVGCGASAKDLGLVREDVTRLRRENLELTRRVGDLEAREATRKNEEEAKVVPVDPAVDAPSADGKTLKVVKLAPPTATKPEPPPSVDDDGDRPLLEIGPGGEEVLHEPKGKTKKKSALASAPAFDPQGAKDYEAAYALVKAKKCPKALDAFAGFLVKYPDHPYAANALYWRGECYYSLGELPSAIAQFEALSARFPASAKTADGLLKLGLSHRKLGNGDKAKLAFARLRKEFPTSEAAKKIPPEDAS